ncbi:MAG: L-rhamnose isomerase [Oscillospiraceae bacterium]|nr:L-rhamnose isomerase [Oscillospiraceae bacterium]
MTEKKVLQGYAYAKEVFGELGVDVDAAIAVADQVPISMHCWQGDDLIGYDGVGELTGGIAATGNYPGRARNAEELKADIDEALKNIPGKTKLSLHASYAELNGKKIDRDSYTPELFDLWLQWAKERGMGLDMNPTFFSHPKMDGNFTLASLDKGVRDFWIEHGKRCREIAEYWGKELGQVSINNFWMPDGFKDVPSDTYTHRKLMEESLDEIFSEKKDPKYMLDAVESKLFGFGIESHTVVSHEFAMGYAISRKKLWTMDAGHFHPTESVADKVSTSMLFLDGILLHISRPVRWDSDHVPTLNDDLQAIMNEIVRGGFLNRAHIAQDYFDASINRIACWVIAMRNTRKALLKACLEPVKAAVEAQEAGDFTSRLSLLEENKSLPYSAIWDYYCMSRNVPVGRQWLQDVKRYETDVLFKRI